jgi:hypothetical protein
MWSNILFDPLFFESLLHELSMHDAIYGDPLKSLAFVNFLFRPRRKVEAFVFRNTQLLEDVEFEKLLEQFLSDLV